MKKLTILFILLFCLSSLVLAVDLVPNGDVYLKDKYAIRNASNITVKDKVYATSFCDYSGNCVPSSNISTNVDLTAVQKSVNDNITYHQNNYKHGNDTTEIRSVLSAGKNITYSGGVISVASTILNDIYSFFNSQVSRLNSGIEGNNTARITRENSIESGILNNASAITTAYGLADSNIRTSILNNYSAAITYSNLALSKNITALENSTIKRTYQNTTASTIDGWASSCSVMNSFISYVGGSYNTCTLFTWNATNKNITNINIVKFDNGGAVWSNGTHICIGISC